MTSVFYSKSVQNYSIDPNNAYFRERSLELEPRFVIVTR